MTPYIAVIEREDGSTYEQPYYSFEELNYLLDVVCGDGIYKIVAIY